MDRRGEPVLDRHVGIPRAPDREAAEEVVALARRQPPPRTGDQPGVGRRARPPGPMSRIAGRLGRRGGGPPELAQALRETQNRNR